MKAVQISRVGFLFGSIVFVALILLSKLFLMQVVHSDMYRTEADDQYIAHSSPVYDRGSVYFVEKNGTRISAATLRSGYVLAINPSVLKDTSSVYDKLSQIVEIDRDSFLMRAGKTDDPYEVLLTRLDADHADAISDLDIDGVILVPEKWRFYPGNELAAHTLGFVGYKDDVLAGRYGLERYYDDILKRGNDKLYVNFFAEVFSNLSDMLRSNNNKNNREGDIVTTIEPSVQNMLEEKLQEIEDTWQSEATGGIILDPKTGAVYALGSRPTFDPNEYNLVDDQSVFVNPLVEDVYEMGSTVKPLTMAMGLDMRAVTAETTYNDEGCVVLDGARMCNYDFRARGVVPMQEVLNQSLNTGVVHVMEKIGKDAFRDYMYKFGINERSHVDLPGDAYGIVNNLKSTRMVEYATASFGQGIAITPFTMARALSVLANGGVLITPHVMNEIDYAFGFSQEFSAEEPQRVISEETSDEITRMLVEVVDSALLNGTVKMDDYSIAAKTGTAQIANPEGGYYDDRYLHSFFGYFPAYDPKFLVFLYTIDPKEVRYASQTLTHPFMDITKFLINYYDVPPDR
jgi:stage V sporulation protein D (sporulation-specific penicillin-binding protein)